MNVISIIIFAGFIQGLFLSFTLWIHNKGNRTANKLLALLIFCFSIYLLVPELVRQYPERFSHLIASTFPLLFLLGPFALLYVYAIWRKELKIDRKLILHFVPAVLCILILTPFFIKSAEYKLLFFEEVRSRGMELSWTILWGVSCVHFSLYSYIAAKKIKEYDKELKKHYSNIDEINLSWLKHFLMSIAILWALYLLLFLLSLAGIVVDPYGVGDYIFAISVAIIIFAIGFMAFRKPEIFSNLKKTEILKNQNNNSYAKSGLNQEEAEKQAARLIRFIEENKPYLNSDLTLEELAEGMNIPPKYISEIINKKLGKSFYELINIYRAKEAGRIIKEREQENIKLLEVMFDSGFNSKSTFNKYFKKAYSKTPSQFKSTNP